MLELIIPLRPSQSHRLTIFRSAGSRGRSGSTMRVAIGRAGGSAERPGLMSRTCSTNALALP